MFSGAMTVWAELPEPQQRLWGWLWLHPIARQEVQQRYLSLKESMAENW